MSATTILVRYGQQRFFSIARGDDLGSLEGSGENHQRKTKNRIQESEFSESLASKASLKMVGRGSVRTGVSRPPADNACPSLQTFAPVFRTASGSSPEPEQRAARANGRIGIGKGQMGHSLSHVRRRCLSADVPTLVGRIGSDNEEV
jgi:hypothetical protein